MPILLLTRPEPASSQVLSLIRQAVPDVHAIISPAFEIVTLAAELPLNLMQIVLTSATGAAQAARLGVAAGTKAWCVGDKTAAAARSAGFDAVSAGRDAQSLIEMIRTDPEAESLCHIRGVHSRGDVAQHLTALGKACSEVIAYDQRPCPLTRDALQALTSQTPVVLPLFSPRTADLIACRPTCPLTIVAMSEAVAEQAARLGPQRVVVAQSPNSADMIAATCRLLIEQTRGPASL